MSFWNRCCIWPRRETLRSFLASFKDAGCASPLDLAWLTDALERLLRVTIGPESRLPALLDWHGLLGRMARRIATCPALTWKSNGTPDA